MTEAAAGDFILTSAAIRETRRLYPDAYIVLMIYDNVVALAENCPYVDEIVVDVKGRETWASAKIFEVYKSELPVCRQLLNFDFDVAFRLGFHLGTSLLLYMCGAKNRFTVRDTILGHLATQFFNFTGRESTWHTVNKMLLPLDRMLGIPISDRSIEVWYTATDLTATKVLLAGATPTKYALIMGGREMKRHYPPEKYAKLAEMIFNEEPNATFIILGGGDVDAESAEIFKNAVPDDYKKNIIDLTNQTNLRQSIAILSLCDMYIGNNTGTLHAAAAVKCPALSLHYFPADVKSTIAHNHRVWYPYDVPNVTVQPKHALPECEAENERHYKGCRMDFPHCITEIAPETLFDAFHILKQRIAQKDVSPCFFC